MIKKQESVRMAHSRRQFLRASSLTVAGSVAAVAFPLVNPIRAAESNFEVKIGLIGCGGRGTGAVLDALGAARNSMYPTTGYHSEDAAAGARLERKDIKVVALADLFPDRLARSAEQFAKVGIQIPQTMRFTGFDAYQQLLAVPDITYVVLATPPHFRPIHVKAAVEAGKHVFMEKPVAVDVPGVKMVMEAGVLAAQKGLGIATGTQRRHAKGYQETIRRIRDGAIGEIVYARCHWCDPEIWYIERQPGWSDVEYQIRNWNYFTWLSGDHYVEQHVHSLDVMNWVLGSHPTRVVVGTGGRQVRTGKQHGHIYDHFAVEYEYPGGVRMFSQARQMNGCDIVVDEGVVGTAGVSNCCNLIQPKKGAAWRFKGAQRNPYSQEHVDLIASIRAGKPINEAQTVAESTMTAILGREAVYSGKSIEWDAAMKSTRHLGPEKYELGPYPTPEVPMPGRHTFV
jgi:predicted dehydrogenase